MKKITKSLKNYKFALFILLIPVSLLLQLICKNNPQLTESIYSREIYPALASIISPIFGILTFSAAETILTALIILLLIAIIKSFRRFIKIGPIVLLRGFLNLTAIFSIGFFLFTVMWGLNYYREPLATNLKLKVGTPTVSELSTVMNQEIEAINKLCPQINYDKNGHSYYPGGPNALRTQVNAGYTALDASLKPRDKIINHIRAWPKSIFLSQIMTYTGTLGMFIPFTYEPSFNTDVPQFVIPFDISHESAHFKGFAREDEANFLAYLSCKNNPNVYYQYSGYMNALIYVSSPLYTANNSLWQKDISKLDRRAASDLNYYNDFFNEHESKTLTNAANSINNSYLKSQGQAGIISYNDFVNLLCDQYRTDGN
jgi:hypothetical protein